MRGSGLARPASDPKAIWLWALLGSLAIHAVLMGTALIWKAPTPPKARRVVLVEAISLLPSGGGQRAPAAKASPPAPKPAPHLVSQLKPKPILRRPNADIRKAVTKPKKVEVSAPPPPALALPKPAPSRKMSEAAPVSANLRRPASSGHEEKVSGGGRGGGTGSASGIGQGHGSGAGSILKGYLREVRRLLERQKEYPRMARRMNIQGVAMLQFTIAADGRIETTRLCRSSGHGLLDEAAQATVKRVGRFPPLPDPLRREKLTIEIPLAFRLTEN